MTEPRSTPVHRSLLRPELVMGCEREPVLLCNLAVAITAIVGAVSTAWISLVIALVFYFVAVSLLRRMAKKDPEMTRVWRRYINYRHYYSSRSSYWAAECYKKRK